MDNLPRQGTIKRAVVDALYDAGLAGMSHGDLRQVYWREQIKRGRSRSFRHNSLTLYRILCEHAFKRGKPGSTAPWVSLRRMEEGTYTFAMSCHMERA